MVRASGSLTIFSVAEKNGIIIYMIGFRGESGSSGEEEANWKAPENKDSNPSVESKDERPKVPFGEISIDFVRSSGPGGQKVNKTSSKAQLRWNVGASEAYTDEQKVMIREVAGNRLNADDEVVLSEQNERSQFQNKDTVIKRLQKLVVEALTPKKKRKPTKPSKAQKQRRLDEKKKQGQKKKMRKPPRGGW